MKIVRITTVPVSFEKLLEGQLCFMRKFFEIIAISSDNFHLQKFGKREGVRTVHIEMTREITILKDLGAFFRLIVFYLKEKPQIVHTHTPKAGTLGLFAAWFCGVPVRMHTVAGLPLLETKGGTRILLDFVERITYACSTNIYPNSYGLKEIINKNGLCKMTKMKVLGNGSSNGINTNYFSPKQVTQEKSEELKEIYKLSVNNFVFIFIGRLVADKGINELVIAFNSIFQRYPNAKLLLVGKRESQLDPIHEDTEQILQNNPSILQAGYQSDVRPFLSIADVLVFPSYREGFPNVVMQAGAMGLPSIVTNINGCNEIIKEDSNGLIIQPKDVDSLKKAMIELLENVEKRRRLARNARKLIVDRYEQNVIWELIRQEYVKQLKLAGIV